MISWWWLLAVFWLGFILGFVVAGCLREEDPAERILDDNAQMEALRAWHDRRPNR